MIDRRHNDPQSPHERARVLASDRLDGPLSPSDATWLADHRAGCPACDEIATAYAADRELLRSMPIPEPPRDLWARTSVALDRERAGGPGSSAARSRQRVRWESLAGILAVLVVGVVVGRTLLWPGSPDALPGASGALPTVAGASSVAGATPLAVNAGDVAWAAPDADGSYILKRANVTAVCSADAAPSPDCAPLDAGAQQLVALTSRPGSVALAPQGEQAAVVESNASTKGGSILVVPIQRSSPPPSPSPSVAANPSATASSSTTASPSDRPTSVPSTSPTETPTATPSKGPEASPTATPKSTTEPSPSPSQAATASPSPTATAAAGMLAIISNVIVVGSDAAYSADGAWLAFSARPADGSHGPDVYVWQVGDNGALARPITTDHATVFSDWVDGRILASSAVLSPAVAGSASPAPTASAVSMLLDPDTGKIHGSSTMPGVWRPVVDPTGRWAAYWTGTLALDATSGTYIPDRGSLVIADWRTLIAGDPGQAQDAHPLIDPSVEGTVRDWEVRWDPTGRYLGVWVADPLDGSLGRLDLVTIDRSSGTLDLERKSLLRDATALPGFAMGDGRIIWATPSGQDGEGSRLFVLGWKGPDAGQVKTLPAPPQEDIVVVH